MKSVFKKLLLPFLLLATATGAVISFSGGATAIARGTILAFFCALPLMFVPVENAESGSLWKSLIPFALCGAAAGGLCLFFPRDYALSGQWIFTLLACMTYACGTGITRFTAYKRGYSFERTAFLLLAFFILAFVSGNILVIYDSAMFISALAAALPSVILLAAVLAWAIRRGAPGEPIEKSRKLSTCFVILIILSIYPFAPAAGFFKGYADEYIFLKQNHHPELLDGLSGCVMAAQKYESESFYVFFLKDEKFVKDVSSITFLSGGRKLTLRTNGNYGEPLGLYENGEKIASIPAFACVFSTDMKYAAYWNGDAWFRRELKKDAKELPIPSPGQNSTILRLAPDGTLDVRREDKIFSITPDGRAVPNTELTEFLNGIPDSRDMRNISILPDNAGLACLTWSRFDPLSVPSGFPTVISRSQNKKHFSKTKLLFTAARFVMYNVVEIKRTSDPEIK